LDVNFFVEYYSPNIHPNHYCTSKVVTDVLVLFLTGVSSNYCHFLAAFRSQKKFHIEIATRTQQ